MRTHLLNFKKQHRYSSRMVKTEIQCTIKDTLLMPSNYISCLITPSSWWHVTKLIKHNLPSWMYKIKNRNFYCSLFLWRHYNMGFFPPYDMACKTLQYYIHDIFIQYKYIDSILLIIIIVQFSYIYEQNRSHRDWRYPS